MQLLGRLIICLSLFPAMTWAVTLNNVQFATLPGDRLEVQMTFDGQAPEPKTYTVEKPAARIAVDLPGTSSEVGKYHNLGSGNARSVTVIEDSSSNRTRMVISLTEMTGFTTRVQGNQLFIMVGGAGGAATTAVSAPAGTMATTTAPTTGRVAEIKNVDFRRGENGEGQVIITLSRPDIPVDLIESGGRIRAAFDGANLPENLRHRLDVKDFATPVQYIDIKVEGGDPVIYVDPTGYYEYIAYQADETFVVDVKPMTKAEVERQQSEKFQFTGDKLSLNFQSIEVRSVLQLIADFTGLNMVASDTVKGSITLRLQNVPWDQALDLVLKTKGLDKRLVGNVMMVAPAAEIAAREKLELENNRQVEELAPLRTEFIAIRYAKASAISKLLSDGQGLMSARGSVAVDARTNTLLIQDTDDKIENVRQALKILDVAVRQVQVEARVVTADAAFADDIGVRWGGFGLASALDEDFQVGANLNAVQTLRGVGANGPVPTTTGATDLYVDLAATPVAAAPSRFAIGLFKDKGLLEFEISALQSTGRGAVVAQPKVITADRNPAKVLSGTEIAYQSASSNGTNTSFKTAALSLDVTPQITPDGRIIMDLAINQDTVGPSFNGVPSINTNQVTTQVVVDNGETIVLGGVFNTTKRKDIVKVPFFGDLPYIGRLFSRESTRDNKNELLIFVTPKLIEDLEVQ